jgi:uncharacterized protein YndB with AHSA1/START domain
VIRRLLAIAAAAVLGAIGLERWLGYRAGGRDPDPIRSFVVIDAPPERVWEELADIEGQPRWMRDMKEVRVLTSGPVGAGTRGEAHVRIFGIGVTDPVSVSAFDPPRRFAIRHEGAFKGGGEIRLEAGADGSSTIVRWDETLVPPLLPHVAAALQRPILGRIFQADLIRLRELLETPPSITGDSVAGPGTRTGASDAADGSIGAGTASAAATGSSAASGRSPARRQAG